MTVMKRPEPLDESWLGGSLIDRFEACVVAYGSRLAVESNGQTITYQQLNARANSVANDLIARGVRPGHRVALLLDQGISLIAGIFGVLKAACTYVPLDPTYPSERNAGMLADARVELLVTERHHQARALDLVAAGVADVVHVHDGMSRSSVENPALPIDPSLPAYILYTSGSTGRPKGVVQSHRSVLHNAVRHTRRFGITHEDRQTLLYPCSVYGGTRDTFNALLNGAALSHYPVREAGYAGLAEWLTEKQITIYCSVASIFRRFARELDGCDLFPNLRMIKLGGEAPFVSDIEMFKRLFTDQCTLLCGLGSTETGMSRGFPITRSTPIEGHEIPLGYPVEGVKVTLLDEERQPVEAGQVGEIAIQSRYIASGYFGLDELNRNVFLQCEDDPESRIFMTGDLGVMQDDGCLYHRGRRDHQVKIRGNRVELFEIEDVLNGQHGIRDAVVLAESTDQGDTRLVSYLALESAAQESLTVHGLRECMKERLPRFMIPSRYRVVDHIPLTANGKVDRLALREMDARDLPLSHQYVGPVNMMQQKMVDLWVDLLGVGRVSITESFFDVGGDSLLAVDLILRIEQEFGRAPTLATLLRHTTIETLTSWVTSDSLDPIDDRVVVLRRGVGSKPPLFVIPGKGGSVLSYRALVDRLEGNCSVIGLQFPGIVLGDQPLDRVDELADTLLQRVRLLQPTGPYRLLGYSFGGLVCYEMACRLDELGETVSYLGMIDSIVPGSRRKRHPIERMKLHARALVEAEGRERWHYLRKRLRSITPSSSKAGGRLAANSDLAQRLQKLSHASGRAAAQYRPSDYHGSVCLMQCAGRPEWMKHVEVDPSYGWRSLIHGGLHRIDIPGEHRSVFTDAQVDGLAGAVNLYLDLDDERGYGQDGSGSALSG